MRLPNLSCAALSICATAFATVASGQPRTEIAIFRYDGAVSNSEAMQAFDAFYGMIRQKILNIQDHVTEKLGAESQPMDGLDYIFDLKVDPRDDSSGLSRSEVVDWLGNQGGALQAYQGTIIRSQGGGFNLLTRCYVLETPDSTELRAFNLQTTLAPSEFATIRDSHSLMILYGIALEAHRLGVPGHRIMIVIEDAINLIADIENRQAQNNPDLDKIRDALTELSNAL